MLFFNLLEPRLAKARTSFCCLQPKGLDTEPFPEFGIFFFNLYQKKNTINNKINHEKILAMCK